MTKTELKGSFLQLIDKIKPGMPEAEVLAVLSQIIGKVGNISYRLPDMPLVTGALNLLISGIVLDLEENEKSSYEGDTALKTLVDLARL